MIVFLTDIDDAEFAFSNIAKRLNNTFARNAVKRTNRMPKLGALPVKPRRATGLIPGRRVKAKVGGKLDMLQLSPRIAQPISYRGTEGFAQGLTNVRSRSKYGLN
jgi:hypothetical protein